MPQKKAKGPNAQPLKEKVYPPELLCDVEVEYRPKICSMLDSMVSKRRNLFVDQNWTSEKCTEMFKYIQKNILENILGENIFLSLEIQDLFQTLCDYMGKLYQYDIKDIYPPETDSPCDKLRQMNYLNLTRMKFIMIQIMDEVYKELFQMEMDEDFSDEEETGASTPPSNNLYKKFSKP